MQIGSKCVLKVYANDNRRTRFPAPAQSSPKVFRENSTDKSKVCNFIPAHAIVGTTVAEAKHDKKAEGSHRVSSLIEVVRCFGGGALHLSSGGSFGGTELPITVEGHRARLLVRRPVEARGSLAGLISSHKP